MASIPRRVNNPFRATRITSDGNGTPSASGSVPVYRGTRMWPGIAEGDARCLCSWAWRGETRRMEVKARSEACPVREHWRPS